MEDIQF
jgi:hypothetical protein